MTQDKRFRETEEQILRLFFERNGNVTIGEMARAIGVSRATIYRHHHSIDEIVSDYSRTLLEKCKVKCDGFSEKQVRRFFLELLLFIVKNKLVFMMFFSVKNRNVLMGILVNNKEMILKSAGFTGRADKAFNIYCGEVLAVIQMWSEDGLSWEGMSTALEDILFLTKTLKTRLGVLSMH